MAVSDARSQSALGFLTILEHQQHGLVGGYLLLNTAGRPLEFHCTAPVKATRCAADPVRPHAAALSLWRANRADAAGQSRGGAAGRMHQCRAGAERAGVCGCARGAGLVAAAAIGSARLGRDGCTGARATCRAAAARVVASRVALRSAARAAGQPEHVSSGPQSPGGAGRESPGSRVIGRAAANADRL